MNNVKVLKDRATKYDNLIVCQFPECEHKFSSGEDYKLHYSEFHEKRLTGKQWFNRLYNQLEKTDLVYNLEYSKFIDVMKKVFWFSIVTLILLGSYAVVFKPDYIVGGLPGHITIK